MFQRSAISFPQPQALVDDPRLKNILQTGFPESADVVLLGMRFDGGVVNGGGRVGAAEGPEAFRNCLLIHGSAFNVDHDCDLSSLQVFDAGNLEFEADDIHEVHRLATVAVRKILAIGAIPFLVGGGHDLTFAHVRALAESTNGTIGGINIDGHFDVRPTLDNRPSSGTPFRRIMEELPNFRADAFVEFGTHGHLAAKSHFEFLKQKGSTVLTLAEIRARGVKAAFEGALEIAGRADLVFVSFDIDSVAQAFAPGCSAPSSDGFFPADVETMAYLAGSHSKTRLLDLLEFNPKYDIDNRTARLAVSYFAHALTGVAKRATSLRFETGMQVG